MKRFFEWLEGNISRGRRVMLISALFSNIVITYLLFGAMCAGIKIDTFFSFYTAFLSLGVSAIGFYTATSPKYPKGGENGK